MSAVTKAYHDILYQKKEKQRAKTADVSVDTKLQSCAVNFSSCSVPKGKKFWEEFLCGFVIASIYTCVVHLCWGAKWDFKVVFHP